MGETGRPSSSSLKRLRYFRYSPAVGGFGGDWDTLAARSRFRDGAELGRILAALGYTGEPPLAERHTTLGFLAASGIQVHVTVSQAASRPIDENTIDLLLAVYVTNDDVERASHLETWLDAQHIPMVPAREAS